MGLLTGFILIYPILIFASEFVGNLIKDNHSLQIAQSYLLNGYLCAGIITVAVSVILFAVIRSRQVDINHASRDELLKLFNNSAALVDKITMNTIDEMGADIVGIGGTTPTFIDVAEIAKLIKKVRGEK